MQYGSIGWSVGALLGYAQALLGIKRVIACIGDGSFQVKSCNHKTTHIKIISLSFFSSHM
jgi:pyruvate decarboxylase